MSLSQQINDQLKQAMKAKDQSTLRGLRAIKASLLLLQTQEGGGDVTEKDEMEALVKMAKQRKDSIKIFNDQGRTDLSKIEEEELSVIEKFLPAQLTSVQVEAEVKSIITQLGASSMRDMGKVMGMANGKLKGKADGKLIADIVKGLLAG
ncbi:MAG: GatB/YqeY domain-containing protein [Bacteroidia bacterium]|nr:GatB/YqeY domain-containing protein [Bacteroidia bacterium]|tara:strand:+ start:11035 stop:11484 length:450 start_codon:yes stop_codon:yes gene_type:complete